MSWNYGTEQYRYNNIEHEEEPSELELLRAQVIEQQAAIEQKNKALADIIEWCICPDGNFYAPTVAALELSPSLEALGARDQVRDVNLLKEVSLIFHCRAKAGTKNGVRLDDIHYQASMYAEVEVMELASKYKSGKWKPNI